MSNVAHRRLKRALPWILVESLLNAVSGIGMMVLIGRLIGPAEYGKAVAAISIVMLIELMSSFGIVEAIVQRQGFARRALDTAFWTALCFGCAGAIVALMLAPAIAWSYGDPDLFAMVGVSGLSCILTAISALPVGLLTRKMRAASLMRRTLVSKLTTLLLSLLLAYAGYGAWSIIVSTLAGSAAAGLMLWAGLRLLPSLQFDWGEFWRIVRFGGPLSLDLFVGVAATRLSLFLIGVSQGYTVLGYFAFALRIVDELSTLMGSFASKFGLAYFSSVRPSRDVVIHAFQRGTHYAAALAFPAYFGLVVTARDALPMLFGPDWEPAIAIVQIFGVAWAFMFTRVLVGPLLRSIDAQRELVSATVITSVLTIAAVGYYENGSAPLLAVVLTLKHMLMCLVSLVLVRKYYGIGLLGQLEPLFAPIAAATAMAGFVVMLGMMLVDAPALVRLGVSVCAGASAYHLVMLAIDANYHRQASRLLNQLRGFASGTAAN